MDNVERLLFLAVGLAVGAVVVLVITKSKASTYHNEEKWVFQKDARGMVTGVTVHREAEQN